MTLLAGLLVGVACWLATARTARHVLRLAALSGRSAPVCADLLVALAVPSVALLLAGPRAAVVALPAGLLVPRLLTRRAERRKAAADRAGVGAALRAVALELRAGADPVTALAASAEAAPPGLRDRLRRAAAETALGGDGAAVLDDGPPGLAALGACWRLAIESGAGLAGAAERLARACESEEAVRREVAAQLAGPRSSAVLLAALPVLGLVLGSGLGAEPVHFLLGSPFGLGCLALGALLEVAGVAWLRVLSRVPL